MTAIHLPSEWERPLRAELVAWDRAAEETRGKAEWRWVKFGCVAWVSIFPRKSRSRLAPGQPLSGCGEALTSASGVEHVLGGMAL